MEIDINKLRYILNDLGYIEEVGFGQLISCNGENCIEYNGLIPEGYNSLNEWFEIETQNNRINAWKIEKNNLVYDSDKEKELIELWEKQKGLSDNYVNIISNYASIQGGNISIVPTKKKDLTYADITFDKEFSCIPVINVTPESEVTFFYVSNKSIAGFRINFYSVSTDPVNFNWVAIGKS